jgi:hypothetical protein
MKTSMARLWFFALVVTATASPNTSYGDDPLDTVDGTESWNDIDTSSVDEVRAWRQWRLDLRRWEAGRVRLESERARMEHYRRRQGGEESLDDVGAETSGEDLQARIDAARRTSEAGGEAERDEEGQSVDDERPWSRR